MQGAALAASPVSRHHRCAPLPWNSTEEAARKLGVHVETLRRWVRAGVLLPCGGTARDYRFCDEALIVWLRGRGFEKGGR